MCADMLSSKVIAGELDKTFFPRVWFTVLAVSSSVIDGIISGLPTTNIELGMGKETGHQTVNVVTVFLGLCVRYYSNPPTKQGATHRTLN